VGDIDVLRRPEPQYFSGGQQRFAANRILDLTRVASDPKKSLRLFSIRSCAAGRNRFAPSIYEPGVKWVRSLRHWISLTLMASMPDRLRYSGTNWNRRGASQS